MHNPHLTYIRDNWANLHAYRIPGTPRPRRAIEPWIKLHPTPNAPKAPLHLDTLDLLQATARDARELLTLTGQTHIPLMPQTITELDTALAHTTDTAWANTTTEWAELRAEQIRAHLNGDLDGQTITGRCPMCKTPDTLRIRAITSHAAPEPYIVCESGHCNPPSTHCTSWIWGNPAWPIHEWEWFGGLLAAENGEKNQPISRTQPPATTSNETPFAA
ncbi:hypothetical protein VVR12_03260 [Rothia sp. LK2588]|uniref:hypothetical protein n=1 Tax=Rothia sp. LK2588 TaxID=3114369 RepID=UPI0034CE56BA